MERPDSELWRVDRTALAASDSFEDPTDRAYWLSRPASERLRAIELLRRITYGEARTRARLQRVLELDRATWD